MRIELLKVLVPLILFACSQPPKQQEEIGKEFYIDVYENVIPELKVCLEAHGGLDVWRQFGGLEYDRVTKTGTGDHSIIDLYTRKDLVKNDTAYTVGYDGANVWITPDRETIKSPRFFHNLHFYFLAFPFVVADPGTNQEYIGQKSYNGKIYNKIRITYGNKIGDSPEDQYILWIDTETNLLDFINYSVTYFDKSRAENFNALVYSDWKEIQGLKVSTLLSSYRWTADSLGEARGSNTFSNIKFSGQQPDQLLFEVPEGALIDELPSEDE